jgi:hypothetical protein
VRHAVERAERLEQQHAEALRDLEKNMDEGGSFQRELDSERAKREELETEVAESKTTVAKAEEKERSARELLDAAAARQAELECRASVAANEVEAARNVARQLKHRLADSSGVTEKFLEAARRVSEDLRRRAQLWDAALDADQFDALEAGCNFAEPTFAQVTHRLEESLPTKSPPRQKNKGDDAAAAEKTDAEKTNADEAGQKLASIVVLNDTDAHDMMPGSAAVSAATVATIAAPAADMNMMPVDATLMAALPPHSENVQLAASTAAEESIAHHPSQPPVAPRTGEGGGVAPHSIANGQHVTGTSTVLSLEFVEEEEPATKRQKLSD